MLLSKLLPFLFLLFSFVNSTEAQKKKQASLTEPTSGSVWSIERVNDWYKKQGWIAGANFIPSNAINQLEMWQKESFDSVTIDRELGWAENTGFNSMRVFLHSMAWTNDPAGFKNRVSTYLLIAGRHKIKTIFVFFDDCWNKHPQPGKQPDPKPGIHNSGWVQDPGQEASSDSSTFTSLKKYVKDILTTFKNDPRILLWDLYNEPGNSDKRNLSLPLLKNIFQWAREVNPDQPITAGLWKWDLDSLNAFQFLHSDIITYHDYESPEWHLRVIEMLKAGGRPLICTEYMARSHNSRFWNILPLLKKENVGAINWGFVSGKTNTIYEWDKPIPDGSQPDEWFHDIYSKDGKPYREDEVNLIRKLTGRK